MNEADAPVDRALDSFEADAIPAIEGRNAWLIQLRWVAVAGVAMAAAFAIGFGWITSPGPLMGIAFAMAMINLSYQHGLGSLLAGEERKLRRRKDLALALQIAVDLGMFTMLLHWSGGIENPFALFFVFHMVLSTMMFPRRVALGFGLLTMLMFGTTVIAEAHGWLPHYPLLLGRDGSAFGSAYRSLPYVYGYLAAFGLTLLGVIMFVSTVEWHRHEAERKLRQQERVGLSRERLVRIGELSAGVAHSVRNPLHGVLNCVDFLRRSELSQAADTKEILELMDEGLQRIESVTSRLLTLTQERPQSLIATDLNEVIREAIDYIDPRLNRAQVTVTTRLGELPEIPLDRERFSEILINILDNAVYACRDGGEVEVSSSLGANGDEIVLMVQDTGEGLPEGELEHLFDPFFTTKSVGEGSGLGLAMAQRLVEEHGGSIRASIGPQGESRFTIRLPLTATAS